MNALPALQTGYVSFGCLNNFCKVNECVLELWARVLGDVAQSRLMMLSPEGGHRQEVQRVFDRAGVDPGRVTFVTAQPRPQYLEAYRDIDVGLDTFPYNGHTTSLDSYWMGVPVVTLVGRTVVGRAGLSQLVNLGLPELVVPSRDAYVEKAVALAGDPASLARVKAHLAGPGRASALFDTAWERFMVTSGSHPRAEEVSQPPRDPVRWRFWLPLEATWLMMAANRFSGRTEPWHWRVIIPSRPC